jgi:hypothetical protein
MYNGNYNIDDLYEMEANGRYDTECPEGCQVESDGSCPHGFNSILIEMGMV